MRPASAVGLAILALLPAPALAAEGDVAFVSRASGPAGVGGDGHSVASAISADGQRVAFESYSGNLTADGATAFLRVFVRDLQAGTTVLAARATDPPAGSGAAGNGFSTMPSMSADGRVVAFVTASTNLSGDDTDPANDVYARDLQTGVTELVSRASGAGPHADGEATAPSVSADGRYVAFASTATNLSDQDVDAVQDVFVRDRLTGAVTLVSRANGPAGAGGDGPAFHAAISADGRYVAFATTATNVIADDASGNVKVLVRDLLAGTTTLVSRASDMGGVPGAAAAGQSGNPEISPDGQVVAFVSSGTNLAADATTPVDRVYVRDRLGGTTTLVSRATGPTGTPLVAFRPSISADGRFVAFETQPGVQTGVRDRVDATTDFIASADLPRLAAGGGFVSFTSDQPLAPGAVAFRQNVFRLDLGTTPPPANLTPPAIVGTAAVGQTLTCATGTWSGAPILTVEWLRAGVAIAGAAGATYVAIADDAGRELACRVTATNGAGQAQATSATVVPSTAPPAATPAAPPVNVEAPVIVQADRLGNPRIYVCDEGAWQNVATPPGYTYRWLRHAVLGRPRVVGVARGYELPAGTSGTFSCEVTARSDAGATGVAWSRRSVLTGSRSLGSVLLDRAPAYGDVRIRGIDVFQTVQPNSGGLLTPDGQVIGGIRLPAALPLLPGGGTPTGDSQTVGYVGVPIDATKPATAIVYVDMNGTATPLTTQRLEVTLSARLGGRALSQTLTQTITNPRVSITRFVTAAQRDDPTWGVQFAVPAAWLAARAFSGERLDLRASVGFPVASLLERVRECDGAACADDDEFRLTGVPVERLPEVVMGSVELRGRSVPGGAPPPVNSLTPAAQVLARAAQLYPGGEQFDLPTFAASLDIGFEQNVSLADHECTDIRFKDTRGCRMYYIGQRMERWQLDNNLRGAYRGYDLLVGVHDYALPSGGREPGWQWDVQALGLNVPPYLAINSGTAGRPLTAAAHELGHAFGAPHAGQNCNGTRIGDDQQGETWPADDMGRLQGTMWDRTAPTTAGGRIDPVVDGTAQWFDLMSYCAPEANAWLSALNWSRAFQTLQDFDTRRRAEASVPRRAALAATGEAIAFGVADATSGSITHVLMPDGQDGRPEAAPTSPLRLRALDAAGQPLADVGVAVRESSEGAPGAGTFAGAVPATAAAVELVRDGIVLDRLDRSRPPSVGLLAPASGLHVRSGRPLVVRWRASDPDTSALEATVDYSPDGGASWRSVQQGPSAGSAMIPAAFLAGATRARVRVAVSDGFNEAQAVSGVFRVDGNRPVARIVRPALREPLRAGERTLLIGSARDDLGGALRGRSLTWYAGQRRLGVGEELAAPLPAGRYALRLVARDRNGLAAQARIVVRVAPAELRLLDLVPPERARLGARTVAIRVRASAPATLRIQGRRVAVGTTARRIVVPLPARPRVGLLQISYRLDAANPGVRGSARGSFDVVRF